ncbi:MAG: amino acid adenylation domain-containing protein [Chloroflexi bacterium]|nr:amino acid adenylation domain-containing protein [Chloroflexota bacterium]
MDNVVCVPRATSVPATLVNLLQMRADSQPDLVIYTFLEDGEKQATPMTAVTLHRRAQAIAAHLQQINANGHRALLLYPPGLAYIAGFFGCLYANVTAVPAYPPDPARLDRTLPRLQAIIKDSQAQFVLTTAPILSMAEMLFAQAPDLHDLQWIASDAIPDETGVTWRDPNVAADTLAFLQYTSGSTGAPKGVMLQHSHLLANSAAITRSFGITPADSGVIWLPPYHDMGLIGGILQPIYSGLSCILMSPLTFLQKPLRWLQAISHYQATISGGPNFAYDLCVRKITPKERDKLDLRSWRLAFSGAEPVRPQTIARFSEAFASSGFQNKAFFPCYGLAEATLLVAGKAASDDPQICTVQKEALAQNRVVLVADDSDGQILVSCGPSIPKQKIAIVNPETDTAVSKNEIGEIWIQGECVAAGYWNQPDLSARIFQAHLPDGDGPYLRTGDLGFLRDGELFIAGRAKDLIIIRGRNLYPQDIELTVEAAHPALRPGCGAAFAIEADGEERLVVVQEVYTNRLFEAAELAQTIRQAVAQTHEVQVYAVVLAQPRSVPKTSSGKIQRSACRQMYLDGELPLVEEDVLAVTAVSAPNNTAPPEPLLVKALRAMEPEHRQPLLESHLSELTARLLQCNVQKLNPQLPLLSLGIDSITSVELIQEIETDLGVSLDVSTLPQNATISQLAALLKNILTKTNKPQTSAAKPASSSQPPAEPEVSPLSPNQRALWFLHQLQPDDPAYNVAYAARFRIELDIPALQRAFEKLVARHPMLRTTFTMKNGEPAQQIHPNLDFGFSIEDAAAWNDQQLEARLHAQVIKPFDLENGPLLRIHILTRSPNEHIVLLSMHHIITDMWSLAIIMYEFGQLYSAETTGAAPKLKPQKYTYTEYVRNKNKMVSSPEGDRLLAFWKKQLAGELPVLDLPADHPRTAVPHHLGARQSSRINTQLTQKIKALAKEHNATPYMVLLAAFQVLLHRYTGQDDIIVGSPKAGRSRQTARLVGYFINPVALRANLAGNPSFISFLKQTRQTTLDAFAHDAYPFPLIVEHIQPTRDSSHPPIFQVVFSWQKTTSLMNNNNMASFALGESGKNAKLGQITIESYALKQTVSPYDLTLLVAEAGDELIINFEYNTSLFEPDTIKRMVGHLQTLLAGITDNPQQPIGMLPLLTQAEQQQILVEWNNTTAPFPDNQCAHHLFEAQVEQTPHAIALDFEGRKQLTYRKLNQRANQLAHYLQKQGVGPEDLIALSVERSPEIIIGILGILKAGAAYVPVDPAYPPARIAFMLEDAQPKIILTTSQTINKINSFSSPANYQTISLDTDWDAIAQEPAHNPDSGATPDNLAYIIYTSGSTGRPKGVMLPHRGLCNLSVAYIQLCKIKPGSRVLQFFSASFDGSVADIFMALLGGGTLCLASSDTLMPGPDLARFLKEQAVSSAVFTPSAITAVPPTDLPALKVLLTGGESCTREIVDRWSPGRRFINVYGPTETTVVSLWYELDDNLSPQATNIPIGHPIPNTQVYILDKRQQPVPIGVPGELYIGGVGVARGYLHRPKLTAEKFIQLPMAANYQLPSRAYRTGDLCRWRSDGNMEFLGRVDHQVKIRGFRIELGEIEAALTEYTAVREAVVITRKDTINQQQLVAYVVFKNGAVSDNDLRRHLGHTLPDYMIPAAFIPLKTLPLSPSGKVDRNALPAPNSQRPELDTAYIQPRNELEQMIAAIWQTSLGVEKVGIQDNFFDLGGHSLMLAQVHNRLQEELQADLPMMELFRFPTIKALADYLSDRSKQRSSLIKSYTQAKKQRAAILKKQQITRRLGQQQAAARRRRQRN